LAHFVYLFKREGDRLAKRLESNMNTDEVATLFCEEGDILRYSYLNGETYYCYITSVKDGYARGIRCGGRVGGPYMFYENCISIGKWKLVARLSDGE
jgi:hypothetical protein